MQKIMFENKRFGLEQAVLAGTKTMTRRVIPIDLYNQTDWKAVAEGDFEAVVDGEGYYHDIRNCGKYHIGEQVAIAQAYENIPMEHFMKGIDDPMKQYFQEQLVKQAAAYKNKLFAVASLMPHVIEITDIKVERLQDISDEDAMREGIRQSVVEYGDKKIVQWTYFGEKITTWFNSPREAFAALIDRLNGRGTWQSNPWVYAYTFELIK